MMSARRIAFILVVFGFVLVGGQNSSAQSEAAPEPRQQPVSKQQQEQRLELESKAAALLEQLVSEGQALTLSENRVRVQVAAGDLLWDRNQVRARALFGSAAALIAQMWPATDKDGGEKETAAQLRQELILTAARHNAELALQLLRSTRPPTLENNGTYNSQFGPDPDGNLERSLLATIAATDPKVAFRTAMLWLDQGDYPAGIESALRRLQSQDREAYDKLVSKLLSKLSADNLVTSQAAGNLALSLLRPGPRPAGDSTGNSVSSTASGPNQVLGDSAYHDLMDAAISAALTAGPDITRPTQSAFAFSDSSGQFSFGFLQESKVLQPDEAQPDNARTLLRKLQTILPLIDQYMQGRAQAVRQKLTELGVGNSAVSSLAEVEAAMQQPTSEGLTTAARLAPPEIQSHIYKQAAEKAIEEGKTDSALQIANDHLNGPERDAIIKAVEIKKLARDASAEKLARIRQELAGLPSDSERVRAMVDLAAAMQKDNPKLALTLLEDARHIVSRRANKYQDFENQLKVAGAYATLDPKGSFDVLKPGISQLNEILAATAVVNGFEAEVFREGELPLKSGSELGNMIARYGWELGSLAELDFDQARITADYFQLPEAKLVAKLSIVQRVLGLQRNSFDDDRRNQAVQVYSISVR